MIYQKYALWEPGVIRLICRDRKGRTLQRDRINWVWRGLYRLPYFAPIEKENNPPSLTRLANALGRHHNGGVFPPAESAVGVDESYTLTDELRPGFFPASGKYLLIYAVYVDAVVTHARFYFDVE